MGLFDLLPQSLKSTISEGRDVNLGQTLANKASAFVGQKLNAMTQSLNSARPAAAPPAPPGRSRRARRRPPGAPFRARANVVAELDQEVGLFGEEGAEVIALCGCRGAEEADDVFEADVSEEIDLALL
eukprot:tig00021717_g23145.t1